MKINDEIKSVLELCSLKFEKLSCSSETELEENDFFVKYEVEDRLLPEFQVRLTAGLKDMSRMLNLECVLVGNFKIDNSLPEEVYDILINKNAVAIMFPYIRSQITLLTSQPEMKPIVIPPININKLAEKQ
jgi:preprotein translocase subunit SecB